MNVTKDGFMDRQLHIEDYGVFLFSFLQHMQAYMSSSGNIWTNLRRPVRCAPKLVGE